MLLKFAATTGDVALLEWLQQNSGRQWTAAELASMLEVAGVYSRTAAVKWLRKKGAEWPNSFASIALNFGCDCGKGCWTPTVMRWALANGCTWGEWQCQQLEPELYTYSNCKKNAIDVFAWAHKNGCPCTCNNSSGSSGSNESI
jgi:hypothetical protein